jgi:hypothetical protein
MLINYNYLKITTDNLTANKDSLIDFLLEYKYSYRLFNTSMIQIDEYNYLCLIRILYDGYDGDYNDDTEPIIPGNSPNCNPKISDNGGKYFWWNYWHEPETQKFGGTLFVKYNINDNLFTEINMEEAFLKFISYSHDLRICEINGKIYIYTAFLERFIECSYDISTNTIIFLNITNFVPNGKEFAGKNFAPFNIITINTVPDLLYLDWFYGDYVLIRHVQEYILIEDFNYNMSLHSSKHVKDIKINFKISGFFGEGSYKLTPDKDDIIAKAKYGSFYGITPGFSFTSPHIEIEENGKQCWIGVGHTKIRNPADRYPYIEGSKIEQFRTNLHDQMFAKYGDKYKLHMGSTEPPNCMGYIYLMYFYKLIHNGEDDYDMFISDSYLPLDLSDETKDDYKFSLVFPMGIVKHNINGIDILKVSCGEGDYNSIILDFDYKKVMESIKYDIKTFDITTYEYYLLAYKNGLSIQTTLHTDDKSIMTAETELNDKIPSEELSKRKYIKYKTKYLQLKYGIKMLN